jgi:predicted enzyme related to lactoylglutathione lyase
MFYCIVGGSQGGWHGVSRRREHANLCFGQADRLDDVTATLARIGANGGAIAQRAFDAPGD